MARVAIPIVVLDRATGSAISGASVTVRTRATNALAAVYTAESGGSAITGSVLATDANGRVAGWVDRGAYKLTVSGSGLVSYDQQFDAAPAADSTVDALWLLNTLIPVGLILPYAINSAPSGWLLCNGQAVVRATYPALNALLSGSTYPYGNGDGTTTMNVPDLRGRIPVCAGTSGGSTFALGATGGEETHTLTAGEGGVAAHGHANTIAAGSHSHTYNGATGKVPTNTIGFTRVNVTHGTGAFNNNFVVYSGAGTDTSDSATDTQTPTMSGSVTNHAGAAGTAHNNLQPYQVVAYIIKAA
jgi:microcystin-dependent protein